MELTKKQRNYIRKHYQSSNLKELSKKLGVEKVNIEEYLITHLKDRSDHSGQSINNLSLKEFFLQNKMKVLVIILASLFVYLNILGNGYVSDDREIVASFNRQNYLREILTFKASYRIPILTHYLDTIGSGLSPFRSHLTNLMLHALASSLVFFVVSLIVQGDAAFFSALLFAVHPLHTDAVSWAVSRSYILFTVFILLTLIYYLKATDGNKLNIKHLAASLIFYLVAFDTRWAEPLSFPLILILYNAAMRKLSRYWKTTIPFFVVSAIMPIYLMRNIQERVAETSNSSAGGTGFSAVFVKIPVALYTYLKLFLIPKNLTFYHEDLSTTGIEFLLAVATVILLIWFLLYSYKKDKIIFFLLGLFILSISHTLTPFNISWAVAERYVYFGSLGLTTIFTHLVFKKLKNKLGGTLSYRLMVMIIIIFAGRTILRNFDWKSEDTLWLATIKSSPTSSKAWNNIGDYYGRQGDLQKSFEAFVKATELNPSYSDAWHNAGNTLLQAGKFDESIPYFIKSLEFNPGLIEAYDNLAIAYHRKGEEQKAVELIEKSLSISPAAAKTYAIWAFIEYEKNNIEMAKQILTEGLRKNPNNTDLQQNLANLEKVQITK